MTSCNQGLVLGLFLTLMSLGGLTCFFKSSVLRHSSNSRQNKQDFHNTSTPIQNRILRYVKLALVIDYEMYERSGKNITKLNERYKNITNIVNSVFLDYNIYVALIDVVIWSDGDKIEINKTASSCCTNDNFKTFASQVYGSDIKEGRIDQMLLMSGFSFPGGYYCFDDNEICKSSFGLVEDFNRNENLIARSLIKLLARRMEVESAIDKCSSSDWRPCMGKYLTQIQNKIQKFRCLNRKPVTSLKNRPVCGNRVVEEGEQCDCGTLIQCSNPSCQATTCMLNTNNCNPDEFECCDSTTGKARNIGTLCRAVSHPYDIPEYCNGESVVCPMDECRNTGEWDSSAESEYISGPYGANETSRFIELALVVDNALFKALGDNISEVNRRYQKVTNIANAFFQEFNIFVVLANVEIWPCQDRIEIQRNATTTCLNFEKYVQSLKYEDIDVVYLISKHEFDGDIDIQCGDGEMCTSAHGIILDNLNNINYTAKKLVKALARKIKINLDESCVCLSGKCDRWHFLTGYNSISDFDSLTSNIQEVISGHLSWSSCTVQSVARVVADRKKFSCLNNKPKRLFGESICGNGFTEVGEECDCGLVEKCYNPCCDATTCTFKANASCAIGECCDLKTCDKRNSSNMCRPVQYPCDLAEYCDGKSEYCPVDNFNNTGEWSSDEMEKENTFDEIRGPYNANKTSRYIELGLVIDNKLYNALNSNIVKVNERYKHVVNVVNAFFQEFNVFVALVNIEIWSCRDRIKVEENSAETYKKFEQYAKTNLMNNQVDVMLLLTNLKFDDSATFYTMNEMCLGYGASGVVMDDLNHVNMIAKYFANVIMLSLGINSNLDNCTFYLEIRATSTNYIRQSEWSPCAIQAITQALSKKQNLLCLNNKPVRLFDGPVCGNGFLERGEECDCGLVGKCDNPCCDATSCKLNINASCAIGECCDLKTCKILTPATLCRSEAEECDLPEYCDGKSEYCPFDVLKSSDEWCSGGPRCDTTKHRCKGPRIRSTAWKNYLIIVLCVILVASLLSNYRALSKYRTTYSGTHDNERNELSSVLRHSSQRIFNLRPPTEPNFYNGDSKDLDSAEYEYTEMNNSKSCGDLSTKNANFNMNEMSRKPTVEMYMDMTNSCDDGKNKFRKLPSTPGMLVTSEAQYENTFEENQYECIISSSCTASIASTEYLVPTPLHQRSESIANTYTL